MATGSMLPQEIFLSHSSRDADFVERLAEVLRRHGLPLWYSRTQITGAQQWHDQIGVALDRCDWFLLVLSPQAVASPWVKRELLYALNTIRYQERIVPLLFQPCDQAQLSWTLPLLQFVDFTSNFDDGCRALLRVWGQGYRPSALA